MMSDSDKISIILPVYNAEEYLEESILSVLEQSWSNWELIIVNDGSEDNSQSIIDSFSDNRIVKSFQKNQGVSAARNKGLELAGGDFICFLDADDKLTNRSLESRLEIFKHSEETAFVDGKVEVYDDKMDNLIRVWKPDFKGNPFKELISLNENVFFGPSWMIKKEYLAGLKLEESMTHAEDLLFYIKAAANGGKYDFTDQVILQYRRGHQSAMKNLKGLEKGYKSLIDAISKIEKVSETQIIRIKKKVKYMMIKAYLRDFDLLSAISVYLNK